MTRLISIHTLALATLLVPAGAAAKPPRLEAWKGDDGRAFSKPVGWTVGGKDVWTHVGDPAGTARIDIHVVWYSDSAADYLDQLLPGARHRTVGDWTCAEGTMEGDKVVACGRDGRDDPPVVHAKLIATPKRYKALGGVKLLVKVLDTVEGFPVETEEAGAPDDPEPPPAPAAKPRALIITPKALEESRVAGSATLALSDEIKQAMTAAGVTSVTLPVKVCVDEKGAVSSSQIVKRSAFLALDDLATKTIAAWSFKPYMVNGSAVAVCGIHIFKVSTK